MKTEHVFVDTNILIYALDSSAGIKHKKASTLVLDLWHRPYPPAISVQVLQELYINLVQRNVNQTEAQETVHEYYTWEIVENNTTLLSSAFQIQSRWKTSFWDALIIAAAKKAKAQVLYSEDMQHQQDFDGVRVMNPFAIN